jgi:glycosyltransferase involved in cell wall biosynthesis
MTDLSVIIPARNEEFLQNTIDSVLSAIKADTEIIVILDGYWPKKGIPQKERLNIIHYEQPIGQRAAVNKGAEFSDAKFIMKLDAHCAIEEGFDKKLMADCEYEDTIIPAMYNLHAFDWVCQKCGIRTYQGPKPENCGCDGKEFKKEIVWKPKRKPRSEFYRFDKNMKFAYWRAFKRRPEAKGNLAPSLGNLGACFFMHRQRFFDLDGMDEGHGGWGQFGTEISCKSWLSGGRQLVNKNTWFSHMFRTGGGFGFPYQISGNQVRAARKYSKDIWLNNKWKGAKYDLKWLIKKFHPVPEWEDYVGQGGKADRGVKQKSVKSAAKLKAVTKGGVYYTDNRCEDRILKICQAQMLSVFKHPIISVSLMPIDFGTNITLNLQRGYLTMFKQILLGLETIKADVVYLLEHDILYHPSHFDFVPPEKDVFYYNQNVWKVNAKDGQALFYFAKQTAQVCGYRDLFIEHYRNRVKKVEQEGFRRSMGFEPGTHKPPRGFDHFESDTFMSKYPNIDIRHTTNLTANRFKRTQFRNQKFTEGWTLSDAVPRWGLTKGRFDEFLAEVFDALRKS